MGRETAVEISLETKLTSLFALVGEIDTARTAFDTALTNYKNLASNVSSTADAKISAQNVLCGCRERYNLLVSQLSSLRTEIQTELKHNVPIPATLGEIDWRSISG